MKVSFEEFTKANAEQVAKLSPESRAVLRKLHDSYNSMEDESQIMARTLLTMRVILYRKSVNDNTKMDAVEKLLALMLADMLLVVFNRILGLEAKDMPAVIASAALEILDERSTLAEHFTNIMTLFFND